MALGQFGALPDRHGAVQHHRHHAQPCGQHRGQAQGREPHRSARAGPAARCRAGPAGRQGQPGQGRVAGHPAGDKNWEVDARGRAAEWSEEEVYLSLPRPGGDAWLRLGLADGELEYERTDRGWISYFNDLHKGRNTGAGWSWFIDIFAAAALVFSATGLLILKMHAGNRPFTWPMVGMGLVVPLLLALLFIH